MKANSGFTIIEVILFLAISGMLLIGAFVAMRTGIDNTRFNDTTDTTQSYFQRQYAEVANGINIRDNSLRCQPTNGVVIHAPGLTNPNPGASECVILGRIYEFQPGTGLAANAITSRYLTSRLVNTPSDISDLEAFGTGFEQYHVRISGVNQLEETYKLPWGAIIKKASRKHNSFSGSEVQAHSLAILRSPVSERILVYAFTVPNPGANDFSLPQNLLAGGNHLVMCIQSSNSPFAKRALLTVGSGQGQDLFKIDRSNLNPIDCAG